MNLRLPRDRRTWIVIALAVVGLALVVWAVLPSDSPVRRIAGSDTEETTTNDEEIPDTPAEGPDEILVPSIKVKAPLVPIELASDGVLTPPADTDVVGWWDGSAEPGSGEGQTVMAGHTVSTGGGVLNELPNVDVGAVITVRDDDEVTDYRVTGVFKLTKEEVAAAAEQLFGQGSQGGRLVLVTCTDYKDGDYESNVIVWGEPVDGKGGKGDAA